MADSIQNSNREVFIQSDSLLNDSSVIVQKVTSFLTGDTVNSPVQDMPIYEISDISHEFPLAGDWFTLTILGLLFYLVLVRFLYSFNIIESIKGFAKIQSLDTVGFEKETRFTGYVLSPLAVFIYAVYLYFLVNPLYLHISLDFLFLVFSSIIILLFLVKLLIEKIISLIFNTRSIFHQYFSDHLFILGLSSLVQAPLLIIYIYSDQDLFLWFALSSLILLWLFRLIRGFIIGIKQTTFSKSFIILYLCSLEILPLLIALKLVIG